jgi:para-aminobenzoate synthetase component 1
MDVHVREIDWQEPSKAFIPWAQAPYAAWLDSAGKEDPRSQFSYIAVSPFRVISYQDGSTYLDGQLISQNPFDLLDSELARFSLPAGCTPAPFVGGAIGFVGYEMAAELENLRLRHRNDLDIPGFVFALYDVILAFCNKQKRAWIFSSGFPELDDRSRQTRAIRRADEIAGLIKKQVPPEPKLPKPELNERCIWRAELSRASYEERVTEILRYIRAGDIFQANFTTRFLTQRPVGVSPAAIHYALRTTGQAPFSAFLHCGHRLSIASASPERFLRLHHDGSIETRPIKGTRPRGASAEQDSLFAAELAASVKDRAENLMIVDLMRNDIGRVAQIGSVAVSSLYEIERFASVLHLVSAVTGRLRPGLSAVALLRSTFPPGSVTGAPKIRAMDIIDELEISRRGPYCGTIAWIGFDGAMDASVVIRTLIVTPETVVAQAGGGIVADSIPAAEFDEMMLKVRPLLEILGSLPCGYG